MPSKQQLLAAQKSNFCCWYCGIGLEEINTDHVTPKSRGGGEDPENIVACCRSCNSSKGRRTLAEHRDRVALRSDPKFRAIQHLQQAMKEVETPFDSEILQAIKWLEQTRDPITFYGEKHA